MDLIVDADEDKVEICLNNVLMIIGINIDVLSLYIRIFIGLLLSSGVDNKMIIFPRGY